MIPLIQIRDYVVRPALQKLGSIKRPDGTDYPLWCRAAEQLVIGTGLIESQYEYIEQIGGPALGPFQEEPETCNDTWDNFLAYHNDLRLRVLGIMSDQEDRVDQLAWNWQYAAVMCRIKYLRSPLPLPPENNLNAMATTWKQVYNTGAGAGDSQKFYIRALNAGLLSL